MRRRRRCRAQRKPQHIRSRCSLSSTLRLGAFKVYDGFTQAGSPINFSRASQKGKQGSINHTWLFPIGWGVWGICDDFKANVLSEMLRVHGNDINRVEQHRNGLFLLVVALFGGGPPKRASKALVPWTQKACKLQDIFLLQRQRLLSHGYNAVPECVILK